MGMMSKRKGKSGELEVVSLLKTAGFPARRGQQFLGNSDSPDIVCESFPLYIECKRTESISIYPVMEKAQADAGDKPAVVFHRRNNKPWITILKAEDFLKLVNGQTK